MKGWINYKGQLPADSRWCLDKSNKSSKNNHLNSQFTDKGSFPEKVWHIERMRILHEKPKLVAQKENQFFEL